MEPSDLAFGEPEDRLPEIREPRSQGYGLAVTVAGRVATSWRTPLRRLTAVAPPLRLPRALTQAAFALAMPDATAAGRAQMARATCRRTTRLHRHSHGSGRSHATCHGHLAVATTGDNSIGD